MISKMSVKQSLKVEEVILKSDVVKFLKLLSEFIIVIH